MIQLVKRSVLVACIGLVGACTMRHATPVVAAPATPEEENALRSALAGDWRWSRTVEESGRERNEGFTTAFTFDGSGGMRYRFGRLDQSYMYTVEGRNVRTTHPGLTAFRIDSMSPNEIRAFWYDLSVTMILERQ